LEYVGFGGNLCRNKDFRRILNGDISGILMDLEICFKNCDLYDECSKPGFDDLCLDYINQKLANETLANQQLVFESIVDNVLGNGPTVVSSTLRTIDDNYIRNLEEHTHAQSKIQMKLNESLVTFETTVTENRNFSRETFDEFKESFLDLEVLFQAEEIDDQLVLVNFERIRNISENFEFFMNSSDQHYNESFVDLKSNIQMNLVLLDIEDRNRGLMNDNLEKLTKILENRDAAFMVGLRNENEKLMNESLLRLEEILGRLNVGNLSLGFQIAGEKSEEIARDKTPMEGFVTKGEFLTGLMVGVAFFTCIIFSVFYIFLRKLN
jgi:hypothetical protein